ncbi:Gmad2 immunoglobulin-like domain-containing protein [Patescibacteria group bacterium]|nr:Gmad2 immunoglobulin-like domain-containing protein [Patescibacteria group bacterium]
MIKKFFIIIVIIIVAWLFLRFVVGGPEDAWLCTTDGWVKHGAPSSPMPTEQCLKECALFNPDNCHDECVVCPPCSACSSISCQTQEFCGSMGIDKTWYENIQNQISSFSDCAAAGNAVMESYPRKCQTPDGQQFTEDIGNELEKIDLIRINNPRPNQKVSSPIKIEGEARGYWFFEADFPIKLVDDHGNLISQGIANAQGEWMTEDFVPFTAELEFFDVSASNGRLILEKDNPSDLPENADQLIIPVDF